VSVVVLFGRPGCCLCDDARVVLERVRAEHPFELLERDIERDDTLLRDYLERIPVVTLDGEELFEFAVDERVLRDRLARVRPVTDGQSAAEDVAPPPERLSLGVAARLSRYLQVLTQAR
jgi:hypothetical protein